MSSSGPVVAAESLKGVARTLLIAGGLPDDYADTVAEVLVWADLRSVPSHGVSRIPRYLEMIEDGAMNPSPQMRYANKTGAVSILEADRAPGPVAMLRATEDALDTAQKSGVGIVLVRATTHTAALGFYTRKAAEAGALAIAAAASGPNMAYHGSRQAAVSTSPISIAAPNGQENPLVFDMGAGAVSLGKLKQLARTSDTIPDGMALDRNGNPTTDPQKAHIPMPMAGAKGSGLSLMIEILTSVLLANPILARALDGADPCKKHRQNALVIALDIKQLCDPSYFNAEVRRLSHTIKELPRADLTSEILLPGERGDKAYEKQLANGISLSKHTISTLETLARRYDVKIESLAAAEI